MYHGRKQVNSSKDKGEWESFFPPEVWSHILSFTEDLEPFRLQRVCTLFKAELQKKAGGAWIVKLLQNQQVGGRFMFRKFSTSERQQYLTVVGQNRNDDPNGYYYLSKVIVCGPSGVGKTTFWNSFKNEGMYPDPYPSNIGIEFSTRTLQSSKDNLNVKLQVWDTAGAERFRMITAGYYRGSIVMLFMFALNDRQSLQDLVDRWFPDAFEKGGLDERSVVCYLVGLKVDLKDNRTISRQEAEFVAKKCNMKYFEASGKVYSTVLEVMKEAVEDSIDALTENYLRSNRIQSTPTDPAPTASFESAWAMVVNVISIKTLLANKKRKLDRLKLRKQTQLVFIMGNSQRGNNSSVLFEQFPHEINVIIINLLDATTLLKTSGTCKRWLNNSKYLENLNLCLTKKSIFEYPKRIIPTKRPTKVLAKINWQPLEATFKRFDPKNLRTLRLYPDLHQNCDVVNAFVSQATNLTKLTLCSSHYLDAVLNIHHAQLKEISLDFAFDDRFSCFTNLERLRFHVRHAHYEQLDIAHIREFKNLKSLSIHGVAETYISLEQIAQLVHLKELCLDMAYLTDDQFAPFSRLTNLEVLELSNLQKEIPTDDDELDLSEVIRREIGNPNPVSGLRHLTSLVNLTYLDISNVQMTYSWDEQVEEGYDIADLVVKHFNKLKTINISSTKLGKENRDKLKAIEWLTVIDEKDALGNDDNE